jgi:RNase P/RNase MRP subunit POP5
MKSLRPSMRDKKRYLLIKGQDLKKGIEKAIFDFIGVLGMSKAALRFIKIGKNSAIISINRNSLNHVRASLAASSKNFVVEKVSGTLKGLKKK